jgi:hypothetical protein
MSTPSEPRLLVLHGLRLKGFGEVAAIAEAVDLAESEAKPLLDELAGEGLVTYRDGRLSGFSLTKEGREHHARALAAELDAAGARPAVHDGYRRFLTHNAELLGICTSWQLREDGEGEGDATLNDHSDPDYDAGVIDRLASLHTGVEPICEDLGDALHRFRPYGPRLRAAVDRVLEGDHDWFTKPMIPSYHTVWFELHEDLLSTLGIERGSEAPA